MIINKAPKELLKLVKKLHQKKYRQQYQLFICEGEKICSELIKSNFKIHSLIVTNKYLNKNNDFFKNLNEIYVIDTGEMEKISTLSTPPGIIAICYTKETKIHSFTKGFTLALDNISDPGNLGTIIRTADWFGIDLIMCSSNSVELYNPKVIQSSMGSFIRVNVVYGNLPELLKKHFTKEQIFLANLSGKAIFEINFPDKCCIVIGNEANGISKEIMSLTNNNITIPLYNRQKSNAQIDSLNASIATSIIVYEYFRKKVEK